MIYETYVPQYPLDQFISHFTYYKGSRHGNKLERFIPDGNIEIIIDLTDFPKYIYDNNTLQEIQACKRTWISGIRNHFITIPNALNSEMLIINFKKGMVYPFAGIPLSAITDKVVDAELILGNDLLDLRDFLLNTQGLHEKFQNAQNFLLKKYKNRLSVNPFIEYTLAQILSRPEEAIIKKISANVGYSQKHFIKLFKEQVGISPKAFVRINRFQKAIQMIDKGLDINWASVAYDCGYYDQSHFIADFKGFSGFTPTEYAIKKKNWQNYVPVESIR